MKARASDASRLAIATAVGRSRATSTAKLGPESTAEGVSGIVSAAISDMVFSEPVSIPLAQWSTGTPGGR
jgi:hypothetical protein